MVRQRLGRSAVLAALVALAALVRIAWLAVNGPHTITWDGAEYARAAENLHEGLGYLGLRGGPLWVFPPLESVAIATLMWITPSSEGAGIVLAVIAGALLPLPVYFATRVRYGHTAALIAGAIAATLPYAVHIGSIVLADAVFVTLAATGLAFGLRTAQWRRPVDAVWCGAAFGFAYLARPEGFMLGAAVLATLFAGALLRNGRALAPAAALGALAFVIALAPEVGFLTMHDGHLRLSGKDAVNIDIGRRMAAGMPYVVAADAIDAGLREVGPELDEDYYFRPSAHTSLPVLLDVVVRNEARHGFDVVRRLATRQFGTVLGVFAVLGFIIGLRRRRLADAVLFAYAAGAYLSYGAVAQFWPRYADTLIPLLAVCGGAGLDALRVRFTPRFAPAMLAGATALALLAILVSTGNDFDDVIASHNERIAGTWLKQHAPGATILEVGDQAAYYGHGIWRMLPWAPDADIALRYLRSKEPDFIVLNAEDAAERPFMQAWLRSGIPDRRAEPVLVIGDAHDPDLVLYRWNGGTRTASLRTP